MIASYSENLCRQIGKLRKQSGMTQDQLATRLGVTYQAVSKWENEQACPDVTLLPLLAEVFQISIDELFGRRMVMANLYEGLIAEYLFEGDAKDSSGNGHDGKIVGAALCTDRFGNPESAYCFDGKDDYIVVEKPPRLNSESFSLSVWCWYDRDAKLEGWNNAIISQDGHSQNRVFQLSTYDASITFHRFLHDADLYMEAPLHTEYWYHMAVTYSEQRYKFYKNGMLIGEKPGKLVPNDQEPLYIGRKSTEEPYFFFKGKIDDLRMYERALAEDEVRALFLEKGWNPVKEPPAPAVEDAPLLENVSNVQLLFPRREIKAAAQWYIEHLGFKLHMDHEQQFYILGLYKGPNLYLHSTAAESVPGESFTPFVYNTKRPVEKLKEHLIAAGALRVDVKDEGFAYFIGFKDPFGKNWVIKRDKR